VVVHVRDHDRLDWIVRDLAQQRAMTHQDRDPAAQDRIGEDLGPIEVDEHRRVAEELNPHGSNTPNA